MRSESHDIVVIGSGIAGLSFALHCSAVFPSKSILVLSKTTIAQSNTSYAQGGIAAVMNHIKDSYQQHVDDTMLAGDGLCDKTVVEMVVGQAPAEIQQLIRWGVKFDIKNHQLELGKEGGHSTERILHCKDHTGASIIDVLVKRCQEANNIELRENHFVLELLKNEDVVCSGVLTCHAHEVYAINAHYTMLATGGAGRVYLSTSNPQMATGDGFALAARIGAKLKNMAFVQFHPTVFYDPDEITPFLISEAVRGYGAVLRNRSGKEFMYNYDARGSLATRDVVARAIYLETQERNEEHTWLDLRHLDAQDFATKFPIIDSYLKTRNIDITKEMVPVKPAAHYFCGGVVTDAAGYTSVPHFLAAGECTYTGLHGANRLASNSLLEALVFAKRAAESLKVRFEELPRSLGNRMEISCACNDMVYNGLKANVQRVMEKYVGIMRNQSGLNYAREKLQYLQNMLPANDYSISAYELRNLLSVALLVIEDSLTQTENRGGLYRSDLVNTLKA